MKFSLFYFGSVSKPKISKSKINVEKKTAMKNRPITTSFKKLLINPSTIKGINDIMHMKIFMTIILFLPNLSIKYPVIN